jgi:hypothetical protein
MTRHPVYRVLHSPKMLWSNIELSDCLVACGFWLSVFILTQWVSLALIAAGIGYGLMCWMKARDRQMLEILWTQRPERLGGVSGRDRYDAAWWRA